METEVICYSNLCKVIQYRGGQGVLNHNLSARDAGLMLEQAGYITIRATRKINEEQINVYLILISSKSEISDTKAKFDRLYSQAKIIAPAEVLFVFGNPPSKHITRAIDIKKAEQKRIYFQLASLTIFTVEVPTHVYVPRHRILSRQEVDNCRAANFQKIENYPVINAADSMAVWMGIRPGDFVEITTPSETAGEAVRYRICK